MRHTGVWGNLPGMLEWELGGQCDKGKRAREEREESHGGWQGGGRADLDLAEVLKDLLFSKFEGVVIK